MIFFAILWAMLSNITCKIRLLRSNFYPKLRCSIVSVSQRQRFECKPLFARRKKSSNKDDDIDVEEIFKEDKPGWVSIKWGEDEGKFDMDDRIRKAERFASQQLTKDEIEKLNRALGIDAEELDKMAKEEDANYDATLLKEGILPSQRKSSKKAEKNPSPPRVEQRLEQREDDLSAVRIRGFLELNPYICSGCGAAFQSKNEENPGYLPKDKFSEHQERAKLIRDKQEAVKVLSMAGIDVNSEAAREILEAAKVSEKVIEGVRSLGSSQRNMAPRQRPAASATQVTAPTAIINAIDEEGQLLKSEGNEVNGEAELVPTLAEIRQQQRVQEEQSIVCICQRCFRLQAYGQVEESLRPGWSKHELLTPERFESLLGAVRSSEAVVLCLIDLFDLQGSVLPNLKQIAGPNPIVIAANKIDLLPGDASSERLTTWIHGEVRSICGLDSPRERLQALEELEANKPQQEREKEFVWKGKALKEKAKKEKEKAQEEGVLRRGNVHLVSCQSGFGMEKLLGSVMAMAKNHGNKVYVMGAANVGKSSFINRLLENKYEGIRKRGEKSPRSVVPQATVSNLPGTTLDFLKIKLPNGITMIDTPGLLNKGQLTARLSTAELKLVIPVKPVRAVTLRLEESKCVLIGGLATVSLAQGRPFFFTFFVSNEVKLHQTDSNRVEEFLQKHTGTLVTPPASYERLQELGPFVTHEFDLEGEGWLKSSSDIVIAGLGWVAVTGVGPLKVRVTVPNGTAVGVREALLPFESGRSTATFTGGRILQRTNRRSARSTAGWKARAKD